MNSFLYQMPFFFKPFKELAHRLHTLLDLGCNLNLCWNKLASAPALYPVQILGSKWLATMQATCLPQPFCFALKSTTADLCTTTQICTTSMGSTDTRSLGLPKAAQEWG